MTETQKTVGWTNYNTGISSLTHLMQSRDSDSTLCGKRIPDKDHIMVDYWGGLECRRCFNER